MSSCWFLLSIIFVLNIYFVAGRNVEIARCLDVSKCEPFPAVNISMLRQVEEQDGIPAHVEINEYLVDLACGYFLQISTCIEDIGLATTCSTFAKFYKAYQKLVEAACTLYNEDILAILTCLNDGIVQQGYETCMKTVVQLADQEGYEDDACRMIDAAQSCNHHLEKCNQKSVSRLETFLKEYKLDYCYMFDFIKENNLR